MHYLFYKVHKNDIFMIKFLLEGHENMVQVSTIDKTLPKIQITVAPDFLADVERILQDLQKRFFMQKLDENSSKSQGKY